MSVYTLIYTVRRMTKHAVDYLKNQRANNLQIVQTHKKLSAGGSPLCTMHSLAKDNKESCIKYRKNW